MNKKHDRPLLILALAGFAVWLAVAAATNRKEAWDGSGFAPYLLPTREVGSLFPLGLIAFLVFGLLFAAAGRLGAVIRQGLFPKEGNEHA